MQPNRFEICVCGLTRTLSRIVSSITSTFCNCDSKRKVDKSREQKYKESFRKYNTISSSFDFLNKNETKRTQQNIPDVKRLVE